MQIRSYHTIKLYYKKVKTLKKVVIIGVGITPFKARYIDRYSKGK
ncbi:hypothetical protein LCGC14_1456380 [marine sediment metagenome]|uniref:Uncharacterized protein n=1 Tax=marine sediment metagenome TaxID=412755 RepID=A0A0F9JH47_9ZZZZ